MVHKSKRRFSCKAALFTFVFGGFYLSDSQAMDDLFDRRELAREAEDFHQQMQQVRLEKKQELLVAYREEYSKTRKDLERTFDYFSRLNNGPRNERGRIMDWDLRGDEKDVDTTVETALAVKFLGGALFVLPHEASSDFEKAQKHLKDIQDINRVWENCRDIDYGRWPPYASMPE